MCGCVYALKYVGHEGVESSLWSESPANWICSQLAACICDGYLSLKAASLPDHLECIRGELNTHA